MPGFLTGLVGNMGGVAMQGVGVAANAASTAAKFIISLITTAVNIAARGILAVGSLLAGVVIGGLVSFVAALKSATQSAIAYSRAVIDLRNQTGMSTGMAQGVANRFGAFGFKPGDLTNGGQYHGVTRMVAGVYGVNPYDPASINARAQSFGQGMFGHSMRQNMLSGIGMNNPQGQFLANLPQGRVREQLAYQSQIQSSLGMSPEKMRRFAEDLPLVAARIGMVVDAIKMKFAATLLPIVERTLGRVADYLAKHSDTIGKVIERAGKWLMEDLPPMILKGAISFLNGAGYFLKGFGEFTIGLIKQVPTVLTVLDAIINGIRSFAGFVAGAANVIAKAGQRILGGGGGSATGGTPVPSVADRARDAATTAWELYQDTSGPYSRRPGLNQSGILDSILRVGGRVSSGISRFAARGTEGAAKAGRVGRGALSTARDATTLATMGAAGYGAYSLYGAMEGATGNYAQGRDAALGYLGESNLAGNQDLIGTISRAMQYAGDMSNAGGDRLLGLAKTLEAQLEELRKGNHLSEKTEKHAAQTANGITGFQTNTISRTLSYIAEDTALSVFGQ